MNQRQSRREFLKTALALTGATTTANLWAVAPKSDRLRIALIGCGEKGTFTHVPVALSEQLVALVDADERCIDRALRRVQEVAPGTSTSQIRKFTDYRKLFDVIARDIDAVIVATPNHQHALPALIAMQLGKGAYVEKPLAHDFHEVQQLVEWSRRYKVATQMGNQGHSGEGYRCLCEYIWAGAIGNVTEVHAWTDRANGGSGPVPPPLPVPKELHWDNWIGPAAFCDYHAELHPHEWHGWYEFGNGSLGNMGAHLLDGAVWALKLGAPNAIEVEAMTGGTKERYPISTRIRWDYPGLKMYWYDGKRRPPLAVELEKQYQRDFSSNGTLYVGDKGVMYSSCYGESVRIVPEEKHKAFSAPPKTLPRVKGGHHADFFRACRGGAPACANFEASQVLSELMLLGNLAERAGVGRKVEWNAAEKKCSNIPGLNQYLSTKYRQGWRV
jgi:predicted dehydrogenase